MARHFLLQPLQALFEMDIGDSILIIKTLYPGYDNEIVIAPKTLLAPAEEGEGREWDKKESF